MRRSFLKALSHAQAIQWILFASNASNTAPRLFAFTHLVMYEAWKANNASTDPADPSAVVSKISRSEAYSWPRHQRVDVLDPHREMPFP